MGRKQIPVEPKACEHCGQMFGPTSDTRKARFNFKAQRFCGRKCATQFNGNGREITPLFDRVREGIAVGGEDDCWEWTKARNKVSGYGAINDGAGKIVGAHRVAYQMEFGDFDPALDVLHHCDNPPCCNPKHLFLGTAKDNADDMVAKGRARPNPRKGMKHHAAKLTDDIVREIRASRDRHIDLARKHGVSGTTIQYVRERKTWRHLN